MDLGIENLSQERKPGLSGKRIGLLAHPASTTRDLTHALEVLRSLHAEVALLLGPEHGFFGEAQDMEPVDGRIRHPSGIPLISLYGSDEASLSPTADQLSGLDYLVVDLVDVGARYYTFVWSALLCLRVCHRAGVELVLLDRPNPLGGAVVEGACQAPGFLSFVGLKPVANRHGMTVGELMTFAARDEGLEDALQVVRMRGWRREMLFSDTGVPWIMPSPNMPTFDTALVYPGLCLLEGTWASEGRGTTRPFELFGAPGVRSHSLAQRLNRMALDGVVFRPAGFKPGFQKHTNTPLGGVQIHVVDPRTFKPYRTGVAALIALKAECGDAFEWRRQPYEFETERPAIDLLTGSADIRNLVDAGASLEEISETWQEGETRFREERRQYLLY